MHLLIILHLSLPGFFAPSGGKCIETLLHNVITGEQFRKDRVGRNAWEVVAAAIHEKKYFFKEAGFVQCKGGYLEQSRFWYGLGGLAEISNLQGEIDALTSFIAGPQPAPVNELAPGADASVGEELPSVPAVADSAELRAEREALAEEVKALRERYEAPEKNEWCFAWFAEINGSEGLKSRAALEKAAKWTPGEEISVSFLDGDPICRLLDHNKSNSIR